MGCCLFVVALISSANVPGLSSCCKFGCCSCDARDCAGAEGKIGSVCGTDDTGGTGGAGGAAGLGGASLETWSRTSLSCS